MDNNAENKKISFVVPCYRSEKTIEGVVKEIEDTVKTRQEFDYEIILVNDSSPDNVWSVIEKMAKNNEKVTGINLSKNFGQHSALLAGYNYCTGDYVMSLDDDGQTPADEMFKLIDALINDGYDLVYASYEQVHQKLYRRLGSNFTKRMSDYMLDVPKNDNHGSSYYVTKKFVIDEMIRYKNPFPYMGGLHLRVTRNMGFVFVKHRDRMVGTSGYSFKALVKLWLNGFTAFSVKPLEIGAYIGFASSAIGFLYAIITIIRKVFFVPDMQAGWSSIISIMLILGGIILVMLGLMGEYIGRIYICINNSPQYVIKEIVGNNDEASSDS